MSSEELAQLLHDAQHRVHNLEIALASNRVIAAAAGLVMCQHHLTLQQAIDTLVALSQNTNIKLREVAQRLLDDHDRVVGDDQSARSDTAQK